VTAGPLRSPLGRALGLGSAKEGVDHWWMQRLTALALIPLSLWFVASALALVGADYDTFLDWLSAPLVAIAMILLIAATFYHMALGVQVVIEDYVHTEGVKIAAVVALKLACFALATAAVFAVLKIAFAR
jgi:succinate dehydrogenase / fumarate reductase membrane anchor subunit